MTMGDDGGRTRRPGPSFDADRAATIDRAPVPGRNPAAHQRTAAPPSVAVANTLRATRGAIGRVEAMTAPLVAAIAARDYLESGRLSFEIRSALRRAETALVTIARLAPAEIADARTRLLVAANALAPLLERAPVLEAPGAGDAAAEEAWRAGATPSVPTWAAEAAPIAARLGLGAVDVRADANAAAVTSAENARGVARGDTVYLDPGAVQPGTHAGREVLAHELVHLAQARLPASAGAGRRAAEEEATKLAAGLARGATERPTLYIDLARPAADTGATAARAVADFTLVPPRRTTVRTDWLFDDTSLRRERWLTVLTAFRDAGYIELSDEGLADAARRARITRPRDAQEEMDVELSPEWFLHRGMPATQGDAPLVAREEDGVQVLVRIGDADVAQNIAQATDAQRHAVVEAIQTFAGYRMVADEASRFATEPLSGVAGADVFLVHVPGDTCRRLFGAGVWEAFLSKGDASVQTLIDARIRQNRDLVTAGEAVDFTIAVRWPARVPWTPQREIAKVTWSFSRTDGAPSTTEVVETSAVGERHGLARTFQLAKGETRGTWRVAARIEHRDFKPTTIEQTVEVVELEARLSELEREAFTIGSDLRAERYDFAPMATAVESMIGADLPRQMVTGSRDDVHRVGKRITGRVQPGCYSDSLSELDGQVAQMQKGIDYLRSTGQDVGDEFLAAQERQTEKLQSVRSRRDEVVKDGGHEFAVQATYLSVGNSIASGPLKLVGTVARDPIFQEGVVIEIQDFSQRFSREIYTFVGRGGTFEAAIQAAFWDLCKNYPGGTVAVFAQEIDGHTGVASGKGVGFELDTGTTMKDLKATIFSPIASRIVNLVGTAAMIFLPPPFNVISRTILAAYNSVSTAADVQAAAANGTLTTTRLALSLAEIGLNFLPATDKLRFIENSPRAMAIVQGIDVGGGLLVISGNLVEEIRRLREDKLRGVAEKVARLNQLLADNPSSPEIAELRRDIDREAQELRDATEEVFTSAAADNLIQITQDMAAAWTMGSAKRHLDATSTTPWAPPHHAVDATASSPATKTSGAEPTAIRTTAAAVAGSTFKGRAGRKAPAEIKAKASAELEHALETFGTATGIHAVGNDGTHVVELDGGGAITVRIDAGPLDGEVVSQTWHNPDKQGSFTVGGRAIAVSGRYVVVLSDSMAPENVARALAHEVAEILAERALHLASAHAPKDSLRAGAAVGGDLSPHDRGRIAELESLVSGDRGPRYEREMAALIEEMGLRDGVDGATARRQELDPIASPELIDELDRLGRKRDGLDASHAQILDDVRSAAARDHAKGGLTRPMDEPVRATKDGKTLTEAQIQEKAASAHAAKLERSRETVAELRAAVAAQTSGYYEIDAPMIGGGPAIVARTPGQLVIDLGDRWHRDPIDRIAQTAGQLRDLEAAGLGVVSEMAASPDKRIPVAALRYWQDTLAATGPFVDGKAVYRIENGMLLLDITPAGEATFTVKIKDGQTPVLATGFPQEKAPGTFGKGPAKVIESLKKPLDELRGDAVVGAVATDLENRLGLLVAPTEADLLRVFADLDPALRAALVVDPVAKEMLASVDAMKSWAKMRAADGQGASKRVFTGDDANSPAIRAALDAIQQGGGHADVIVAGSGGTSISAVENVLAHDPAAHVTMVGTDQPAGLASNGQYREVTGAHGSHLDVQTARLGQTEPVAGSSGFRMWSEDGQQHWDGDVLIASLGRDEALPPVVYDLVQQAKAQGGKITTMPKYDSSGRYTHYELVVALDGQHFVFDVTGAASRYMPALQSRTAQAQRDELRDAANLDAPSESGNFAGGYLGSVNQAQRYRREKLRQENAREPQ
jgi:hypothetical protein